MNKKKLQELKEAIDSLHEQISVRDAANIICSVRGKRPPDQVGSPAQLSAEMIAAFIEFMFEGDDGK